MMLPDPELSNLLTLAILMAIEVAGLCLSKLMGG